MSPDFYPEIIEQRLTGSRAELLLALPAGMRCFDGHFPGFPVLPGVVQIHWAVGFARRLLGAEGVFLGMQQIKFNDIVFPGDRLSLALQWEPDAGRLVFDYTAGGRKASSGRILLA